MLNDCVFLCTTDQEGASIESGLGNYCEPYFIFSRPRVLWNLTVLSGGRDQEYWVCWRPKIPGLWFYFKIIRRTNGEKTWLVGACSYLCFTFGRRSIFAFNPGQDCSALWVRSTLAFVVGSYLLPKIVYNDLAHPPATSIGNKYAWRTADGSYNNIDLPEMGKVNLVFRGPYCSLLNIPKGWNPLLSFRSAIKPSTEEPAARCRATFRYVRTLTHAVEQEI